MEVDVVLLRPDASSLANLDGHGARHDVARGKILGGRRVTLHEALTLAVPQDTSLTSRTLGDEAPSAVDAGGVELDKLEILHGETRASHHRVTVSRARVRGRRGEVRAPVATRGQDGLVRPEPVDGAVLHAHRDHADALALVHDEIERKVLHEELGVVLQGLSVQGVKHRVPRPVRGARTPVCLATLAVVQRLAAKSALVDLAVVGATERQAVVLELDHSLGRLTTHVLDGVLVSEPVRALDRVVRMPPPVILRHVAESCVDATLRGNRVRARGEELGDARRLETVLGQADGGSKTRATRTNDDGIVLVVDNGVSAFACRKDGGIFRSAVGADIFGEGWLAGSGARDPAGPRCGNHAVRRKTHAQNASSELGSQPRRGTPRRTPRPGGDASIRGVTLGEESNNPRGDAPGAPAAADAAPVEWNPQTA